MDFKKVHNPYDFANPVSDKDLFIGRKEQLDEIKYYLDHAKTAPRPINLAILGKRASGKTSLLNMCEVEARNREFCTVRIDLDESDVINQLIFFKKIFDSIISSIVQQDYFGGRNGKTYDVYLDMINGFDIPEDKTFCPFIFPIQYAKAMMHNNPTSSLSDNEFKNDLKTISETTNKPIILIFDECNVLIESRILLEKIRNIFMNISGYMLVFTGTPDLFPLMDDVFSPIIRQFKKINIREFKDKDETQDCIRKPLEKINLKPEDIFDFNTLEEVNEIHDLSGGRPYEIQLICHVLFRRVQERKSDKMELDLSVLEDVRKELETSQDITIRPIINFVRSQNKERLKALNLLCSCEKRATFEQLWFVEYVFKEETRWSKEKLYKIYEHFIENKIIRTENDIIYFNGDDFDKIYIKYFAREQKIRIDFNDITVDVYFFYRLINYFNENKLRLLNLPLIIPSDKQISLDKFSSYSTLVENFNENVNHSHFVDLYKLIDEYKRFSELKILSIEINHELLNLDVYFYPSKVGDYNSLDTSISKLLLIEKRINTFNGNIKFNLINIPIFPLKELAQKISKISNRMLIETLNEYHMSNLVYKYLQNSNDPEIEYHSEMSFILQENNWRNLNNVGYINLVKGNLEKAKELFEKALNFIDYDEDKFLTKYNLSITYLKIGKYELALKTLKEIEEKNKEKNLSYSCLIIPQYKNGEIVYKENRTSPILNISVKNAIESIKLFLSK